MVLTASPKEHGTNRFSNDKLYLIVRALLPNTAIYNDSRQQARPVPCADSSACDGMFTTRVYCSHHPYGYCYEYCSSNTASIRVSRSGDYCTAVRISRKLRTWYGQGFLVRW